MKLTHHIAPGKLRGSLNATEGHVRATAAIASGAPTSPGASAATMTMGSAEGPAKPTTFAERMAPHLADAQAKMGQLERQQHEMVAAYESTCR